ncbi:MAG: alpha/beta hydrolase [Candidatus Aminicenantes bacterium]|nr:alpha/beta hydrolase [Candidatus Aminicenantes bacterium]
MIKAMSSKGILIIAILIFIFFIAGNANPEQSGEDSLIGVWQGTVHHPKIGDLEFYFTIGKRDAVTYMGKVDIPAQNARAVPVNSVRFDKPDLIIDVSSFGLVYEGRVAVDFSGIEGKLKVGGELLPLELRRSAGVPEAGRPQEPQKPYPYEEMEVTFYNQDAGIHLSGTLTLPADPGPFQAVVLISGSGPQDRDSTLAGHRTFLVLSDYLTRRGLAVLRYDDRGVLKSEGDYHKATTADFATDAQAAWAFLARHSRVDDRNIGLIGHSEGALIATMVAAGNRDVAFVVLLAGTGIPGDRLARMQCEEISRSRGAGEGAIRKETRMNERLFQVFKTQEDPQLAEAEMRKITADSLMEMTDSEQKELNVSRESLAKDISEYLADYPWVRFFMTYDPAADLRKVFCPVLALNGDKDTQVPADVNLTAIEQALKQADNESYEIKKLPGLNHLFQTARSGHPREYGKIDETFSPTALQLISDWIQQTVNK